MVRAVIYARYSEGPNQTDRSIDGQVSDCTDYATRNGMQVVNVYADRHISGKSLVGRDEFQRMLDDADDGLFDAVIVWKIDRFGRNRNDTAVSKMRLKRAGVKLHYAMETVPEGPEGIILESLLEGLAEYYSEDLRQKVTRGIREAAKKGKWVAGVLPYGYKKDNDGRPMIDDEKAAIVREIFKLHNAGNNTPTIERILASKGVIIKKATIYRILKNDRYLGRWEIAGVIIDVPAIIDENTFNETQKHFATSRGGSGKALTEYLLTNKCTCGLCGSLLIGDSGRNKTGKMYSYYKCSKRKHDNACELPAMSAAKLETLVLENTRDKMLTDDVINKIADRALDIQKNDTTGASIARLENALRDVRTKRKNILTAIENGAYTPEFNQRLNELACTEENLEIDLAKLKIKEPEITRDAMLVWLRSFRDGSLDDARFCKRLINTFVQNIVVFPDRIVVTYNTTKKAPGQCSDTLKIVDYYQFYPNTNPEPLCGVSSIYSAYLIIPF